MHALIDHLLLGADANGEPSVQSLRLANRHGLIAGATGTGKTVTLQRLAEQFSDAGVAVFAADIKGDLCGLGAAGSPQGKIAERIASMPWLHHTPQGYPVTLWDVAGKSGHPLRTTLSEMGPLLLGNLLELTDSQQAALYAAFQVADREGLLLLDLKDLKALLNHLRRGWERSQGVGTWPAQHAYMTSPGGALFVIANDVVITVLLVREVKRWNRRRESDDRDRRRGALQ